jgi:hypothetical protein
VFFVDQPPKTVYYQVWFADEHNCGLSCKIYSSFDDFQQDGREAGLWGLP